MKNQKMLLGLLALTSIALTGCKDDVESELVGNWSKVTDFGGVTRNGAVAFTIGNTAYVGLGYRGSNKPYLGDLWQFDQNANNREGAWTQRADMPGAARNHASAFSAAGKGYVGLGHNDEVEYMKDFWEYDPANNTWKQVADFGGSGRYYATAFSQNDKGYVGTGYDGNHLMDFWQFTPDAGEGSWKQVTSIGGSKRQGATSFVIGNRAYVVGGTNSSTYVRDFWAYDAATDNWSALREIADVSTETYDDEYDIIRTQAVAFVIDGKAYFTLGQNGNTPRRDTWEYNPTTDLWKEKTSFESQPRFDPVAFSVDERGFVGTGASGIGAGYQEDMHEFHPDEEENEHDNN